MTIYFPGILSFQNADETHVSQAPVILDSPHSGEVFPKDFETVIDYDYLQKFADSHVQLLFERAPELGASFLEAHFPRSYIDPNRADDDLDVNLIEGHWPFDVKPTEKSLLGHGLIWKICPGNLNMYDRKLSILEIKRRIDQYWRPYHQYLENEVERLYSIFGQVWHLNCHSMPSISSPPVAGKGNRRADIVLGDRNGTTCDLDFTNFVYDAFVERGYQVRINTPYRGAELVRRYGRPTEDRHSLQIEINRGIYMDEENLQPSRNFKNLKNDLEEIIEQVCAYARHQSYFEVAE